MTISNQSECFISLKHNKVKLIFLHDIGYRIVILCLVYLAAIRLVFNFMKRKLRLVPSLEPAILEQWVGNFANCSTTTTLVWRRCLRINNFSPRIIFWTFGLVRSLEVEWWELISRQTWWTPFYFTLLSEQSFTSWWRHFQEQLLVGNSVTRLGNYLDFGQLFKAFGNN